MPSHAGPGPVVAVILAAGEGRRLGGVCKALIRVQGEPLVWRLVRQLQASGVARGVVVAGAHAPRLQAQVSHLGLPRGWQVLAEPGADGLQADSVRAALAALLQPAFGAWRVAALLPVDLPLLEAADLRDALRYAPTPDAPAFARPEWEGAPAHPVLLNRAAAQAVWAAGPPTDCRAYMRQHPHRVGLWAATNDHGVFDLDTSGDLVALRARTGWTVSV